MEISLFRTNVCKAESGLALSTSIWLFLSDSHFPLSSVCYSRYLRMVYSQLTIVTYFYEVIPVTLSGEADQGVKSNNKRMKKLKCLYTGLEYDWRLQLSGLSCDKSRIQFVLLLSLGAQQKTRKYGHYLAFGHYWRQKADPPKCPHSRWKTKWPVFSVTNARSAKYLFYIVQCKFTFWGSISGKMESTCTCKKYLDLCTCASNC